MVRKIPTLFVRNPILVTDQVTSGCEWVIAGEGVATVKHDGTCCMIRGGRFFKRYELHAGSPPPAGFEPEGEYDPATGKQPGWVPVGDGPEDKWHREAFDALPRIPTPGGTYELCGPKIQGNPEGFPYHRLVLHGSVDLPEAPRDFHDLKAFLTATPIEGIVWHHPDGRRAKLKGRDFGFRRVAPKTSSTGL